MSISTLMDACVALTEERNHGGEEEVHAVLTRIAPAPDFPTEA